MLLFVDYFIAFTSFQHGHTASRTVIELCFQSDRPLDQLPSKFHRAAASASSTAAQVERLQRGIMGLCPTWLAGVSRYGCAISGEVWPRPGGAETRRGW